ncbi:MAG TPA: Sir2 family NAD-dependent protein deacetylase [Tepidisphaeraceae bacterium]|jgi:NAD-dependent SIR2 family protein deacetylase|nr:Sir2 family NAD-dependent protein deacetylase [Tepidisphaeraceae bacterium]
MLDDMTREDSTIASALQRAVEVIAAADALLITAGAGMGVDSGLPDFRGAEGFWNAYPPYRNLDLHFDELANPDLLARDPALAWGFYGHRLNLYRKTPPHAGFSILRRWAEKKPHGYFVFTSNVDGHFERAGFPAARVVECHGSLQYLQCAARCRNDCWPADGASVAVDHQTMRATAGLPQCIHCNSIARPNVLMFSDMHWVRARSDAQYALYERWLTSFGEDHPARLAVVEFGAGKAIPKVRVEGQCTADRVGGTLIRINPREASTPDNHIAISLGALDAIQRIEELLRHY